MGPARNSASTLKFILDDVWMAAHAACPWWTSLKSTPLHPECAEGLLKLFVWMFYSHSPETFRSCLSFVLTGILSEFSINQGSKFANTEPVLRILWCVLTWLWFGFHLFIWPGWAPVGGGNFLSPPVCSWPCSPLPFLWGDESPSTLGKRTASPHAASRGLLPDQRAAHGKSSRTPPASWIMHRMTPR